jgi:drug/metabolite transporter (DMT)-like permease
LAFAGTVFTFGVYLWLLRHLPAFLLSLTSYVVPVIALFLGALIGGEPLSPSTFVGTVLVLGGVGLTLRGRKTAPQLAAGD